jgi:ABC-type transport system involved in multi-copper enzyme maturation permease subunit
MSLVVISETLRRHYTNVAYLVFLGLVGFVALIAGVFRAPASAWQSIVGLAPLVLGAQLIGPELSSGTLQLIIARPITRAAYLLSRVIGVVLAVWLAIALGVVVHLVASLAAQGPSQPTSELLSSAAALGLMAVWYCAFLAFLGSLTRSYQNIAIYFALRIGMVLLVAGLSNYAGMSQSAAAVLLRSHPDWFRWLQKIDDNLFPESGQPLTTPLALMLLSNTFIALWLGCLGFRNREVPYGAD